MDLIYNDKEDFDILFLDIDMPDISGLEVAKKLREKGSDIILIFISAHEQYVFDSIESVSLHKKEQGKKRTSGGNEGSVLPACRVRR